MKPAIFEYEVEVQATNSATRARVAITRREHAYSVIDAATQAILAVGADGHIDGRVTRVQPPTDAILAAADDLLNSVTEGLVEMMRRDGKTKVHGR